MCKAIDSLQYTLIIDLALLFIDASSYILSGLSLHMLAGFPHYLYYSFCNKCIEQ